MGIVYAAFYAVTATLSSLFSQHYTFLSETDIGLCFLAAGGGGALGTIFQGKVLDWHFRRAKKKWEQEKAMREIGEGAEKQGTEKATSHGGHDEDFPIEEATMKTQVISITVFAAALVGYGWSIDKGASIAVPLLMQVIGKCSRQLLECSFNDSYASRICLGSDHDQYASAHCRLIPRSGRICHGGCKSFFSFTFLTHLL